MAFMSYMNDIEDFIVKYKKDPKTRTIEDYLEAVTIVLPPFAESIKQPLDERFRIDGNLSFAKGDYVEAAVKYTHSLKVVLPYSVCSALAYANRSAALYHLNVFEDCIADIDRALNLPYPEEMRQKLITRREHAIAKLQSGKYHAKHRSNAVASDLKYAHGENPKLPGVSLGIEIALSPKDGQGLVAKKQFQPGDIIFTEKSEWAVPKEDAETLICNHCLKTSLCLIPCERCCFRVYCSKKCLTEAYQNYHRFECIVLCTLTAKGLSNSQEIILPLRCLIVLTRQGDNFDAFYNDFEEIEKNPDSPQLVFTEEEFIENKEKVFLSLKCDKQPSPLDLFRVAYTVILLRNYTNFLKTDANVPRLAKLLVKLTTLCAQYSSQITFSGKQKIKAFGGFPLLGLANHGCDNNTIAYIDKNDRIVVHASQCIEPGDQVRCSYHFTTFVARRIGDKQHGILCCDRYCRNCDETLSFPIQRHSLIQLDKSLRSKLKKNPYHIESLWKLLKFLHVNKLQYLIQMQMIKIALIEAYEERADHAVGITKLQMLGILEY